MFCPNCGTQNPDSALFCSGCGEKLASGVVPFSGAPVTPPDTNPAIKKPKKSKKAALIAVIVVAAVALIAAVCATSSSVQRKVIGESQYYLVSEFKNISTLLSAENLADLRHPDTYSANSTGTIEFSGEEADIEEFEMFSDMTVNSVVNYEKSKGAVGVTTKVSMSSQDMATVNTDYIDKSIIVSSDLTDEKFVLSANALTGGSGSSSGSPQDIKDIALDLYESVKPALKEGFDAAATSKRTEFEGKKCTAVTFNLTGAQLSRAITSFSQNVDDETLTTLIKYINPVYSYENGENMTLADLREAISEMGEAAADLEGSVPFVVYYKGGEIIARSVVVGETTYLVKTDIDGDDVTLDVSVKADYNDDYKVDISFNLTKEIKGDKMNITASAASDGEKVFSLSATDICSKKVNGVAAVFGNLSLDVQGVTVNASAQSSGDNYLITVSGGVEDVDFKYNCSISTVLSTKADASNVSVPSAYTSDYEAYFTEFGDVLSDKFEEYMYSNYYGDDYYSDDDFYDYY